MTCDERVLFSDVMKTNDTPLMDEMRGWGEGGTEGELEKLRRRKGNVIEVSKETEEFMDYG